MAAKIKTSLPVYLGLFVALLVVRFPSFFFSVFDWDESNNILIGQSILNGNIPYVHAWAAKPPLLYYVYSLFIALFGKSIVAIRIGGIICIFIASVLLYETGKVVQNKVAGTVSALFLMVFASSFTTNLGTMPEHILLVPVSIILYLLLTRNISKELSFFIGITLGVAIMIKTNMVFESFAICILLLSNYLDPGAKFSDRLKKCTIFAIGASIPIFAVIFYYFANNELDLFLKTNVMTVFKYVGAEATSLSDRIGILLYNIGNNFEMNTIVWVTFLLGTIYLFFLKKRRGTFIPVTLIIFTSQIFSLFLIGQTYGYHYLVTSMPIMCLVSGVALSQWLSENKTKGQLKYWTATILVLAGLLYSLRDSTIKYYGLLFSRIIDEQPLLNDSYYKIARYLKKSDVKGQYIYTVNCCQIVYWLTDSKYPTKYVHPSDLIRKEYMLKTVDGPDATSEKELLRILAKRPEFIIYRMAPPPLPGSFALILKNALESNYNLERIVDGSYCIFKQKFH